MCNHSILVAISLLVGKKLCRKGEIFFWISVVVVCRQSSSGTKLGFLAPFASTGSAFLTIPLQKQGHQTEMFFNLPFTTNVG
jgi:hypothetical protein